MATDAPALRTRAGELGSPVTLADAERLLRYLDFLLEANRHLSLTGIRDREQAVVLHVLDSLAPAALELTPPRCLDLGSGNGFPGVALSVLWPRAIQEGLAHAGFDRCTALHMDAAMVPGLQPDLVFDLVAARAVSAPEKLAPIAAPLTVPGGHLLLWRDLSAPDPDLPVSGRDICP